MKSIYVIGLSVLLGCTAVPPTYTRIPPPYKTPPVGPPSPMSVKTRAPLAMAAPNLRLTDKALGLQVVKIPTQPVLVLPDSGLGYAFTDGNNIVLTISNASPQLYVTNPGQVPFFRVDTSPDLMTWSTLGYFTNFVNGVVLIDNDGQSLAKRFFKAVPQ